MPYTGLRDTTIAHPRMAEGLGALFSNVLARSGSAGHWYGRNFEWYAYTNGAAGYALRGCPAWSGMGHLRLCRPASGVAGQPQEADSPNSIEPT
jgi:hypothetical protein